MSKKKVKFISSMDDIIKEKEDVLLLDSSCRITTSTTEAAVKKVGSKYFISVNSETGELFNPISDKLDQKTRRMTTGNAFVFQFERVNKAVYDLYCEFLKTKNTYLYRRARTAKGLGDG